ncbi:ArsC/Spx/MgsR family protein, partial [Acinetobacter baumannii]
MKIYHNPACGTSRNTLALIRHAGFEPIVIEYLQTPPSKDELIQLIQDSNLTVREAIRKNVDPYKELELEQDHWTDEQLI